MHAPDVKSFGRVQSIQYLRAVAALAVVGYHAGYKAGDAAAFHIGNAGVDIFFVISGFVMWNITVADERAVSTFLGRRIARIAPLYWAVTSLYVAIGLFLPAFYAWPQMDWGEIAKSLLFIPYYSQDGMIFPVVAPGWTLNMEMYFYLLFAVALLAPLRWRLGLLTAMLGTAVALRYVLPQPWPAPVEMYTRPMLLEFLAGVYVGWAWRRGLIQGLGLGVALLAIGLVALGVQPLTGFDPGSNRALYWGAPAVAMVAGALAIERSGRLPNIRLWEVIGDASYSIYLFHTLFLAVAVKVLHVGPLLLFLATVGPLCVASILTHRLFEAPVARFLRRLGGRLRDGPQRQRARPEETEAG